MPRRSRVRGAVVGLVTGSALGLPGGGQRSRAHGELEIVHATTAGENECGYRGNREGGSGHGCEHAP